MENNVYYIAPKKTAILEAAGKFVSADHCKAAFYKGFIYGKGLAEKMTREELVEIRDVLRCMSTGLLLQSESATRPDRIRISKALAIVERVLGETK